MLLLAAIGVVVILLGAGLYVVVRADDSSCLAEAAEHLPEDQLAEGFLQGGDQERARAAGLDDSLESFGPDSIEELNIARSESGVTFDLLTHQAINTFVDPVEQIGYRPSDVNCWIGSTATFVASGPFDDTAIAESEAGRDGELAGASDLVAYDPDGDAARLLDQSSPLPPETSELLDALDDGGAVSFAITDYGIRAEDDERDSQPVAVASTYDDGWELLIVWLFDDSDTREQAEAVVTRTLDEGEGTVPGLVSGGTDGILDGSGRLLVLQAPLNDPAQWAIPIRNLDPVLDPLGS